MSKPKYIAEEEDEIQQGSCGGSISTDLFGFHVTFRRICDGDPTKYGPAWGIYEWTIGTVTVQRHCHDGESPLQQLARILTDPRLESRLSRFDMQNASAMARDLAAQEPETTTEIDG